MQTNSAKRVPTLLVSSCAGLRSLVYALALGLALVLLGSSDDAATQVGVGSEAY